MKEEDATETSGTKALLLGERKFLQYMEDGEVKYAVVWRPNLVLIHTEVIDLPKEIQDML